MTSTELPTLEDEDDNPPHGLGRAEFIVLMSMVSATIAMSIDTVLPAFDDIEATFGLGESGSVSQTVTLFLVGLGVGTVFYGPLADRFGRKKIIYVSLSVFIAGAALATFATSWSTFLVGRVIWGFGAAGQRSLAVAVVRDSYSGDLMARIMSLTAAVFLVVPVLAPAMGSGLLALGSWRWTTGVACLLAVIVAIWFTRMNETLDPANQLPLEPMRVIRAAGRVVTTRKTLLFTIATTMAYGAFFPWLGSSIKMIKDIYGRSGEGEFALWFGGNALIMMVAILAGERLVKRFGAMRVLVVESTMLVAVAAAYVVVSLAGGGVPNFLLWYALVGIMTAIGSASTPLMSALSMEPMGEIAGTAASVTGAFLFVVGAVLGWLVDRQIETTVTAFGVGFLVYGTIGLIAVLLARADENSPPVPAA